LNYLLKQQSHTFAAKLEYNTYESNNFSIHIMNRIMGFKEEIEKRRTFGIVSHPDAGKTTLTEKLLLFGGAIQVAGAVKSNKIKKSATSDFMEIERQRGISVATSVMGFRYKDKQINILDTPGHKDFQEDTYRTLTAVDSAIVVIDVAKGVEPQTEKLVEVCRMRKTPMIVFINKLDREGKDGFELLDEVEQKLGLTACPLSWPIGMGQRFKGVYSIYEKKLVLFNPHGKQSDEDIIEFTDYNDPELVKHIGEEPAAELREDLNMLDQVYPKFDREAYLNGELNPIFFGSAVNNFGVRELLDCFVDIAPSPLARETEERVIEPDEKKFTGFVFKIHANMDPKHRDRIAFLRICSGEFKRNTNYYHVRQDKKMKFSNPTTFMASKKEIVESAFPGDIVGLYDSGNFKIGDSMTEGEIIHFKGIPSFSPEQFRIVHNADPMKSKQLAKGLFQLMDEGVAQMFTKEFGGTRIIGTVGALQFEVIQYRLEHEYGAKCQYEPLHLHKACWLSWTDDAQFKEFQTRRKRDIAKDKEGNTVFLAESAWQLQTMQENYPKINFHFTSDFT
jgi:peptide chain release factor 3